MAKKLGEMNLDETLNAMSELKKNLAKVDEIRVEASRLEEMKNKLNKEVNALMDKKENIDKFIASEEKKLMEKVNKKDKEADESLKEAKEKTEEANTLMSKASDKMAEADKLMIRATQTLQSAKGMSLENEKTAHDIKEIVKFINGKLGKL